MSQQFKKGKLLSKVGYKKTYVDDYGPILNLIKTLPDIEIVSQSQYENGIESVVLNITFDRNKIKEPNL